MKLTAIRILLLTLLTVIAAAAGADESCPDGAATEARIVTDPLPPLDALTDACETVGTPTVSLLVGEDGKAYYVTIAVSTGCEAADAEVRRWVACWMFEPARCDGEAVPQWREVELAWPASTSGGDQPPCARGESEAGEP